MAVVVSNIIPPKQAENVQTTQYTSTLARTIIDKFTVTNNTGGAVTFACNLVVSGGSATTANKVLPTTTIPAGGVYYCPELVGKVLEPGGFISTLAGAATSLTIDAAGRVVT